MPVNATAWTKTTVNATAWTKSTVNPTPWTPGTPVTPTGALLLSGGGFLLLSDGDVLGIYDP